MTESQTERKHTPLPWRNPEGSVSLLAVQDGDAVKVADITGSVQNPHAQAANADFIAKACNSHYDLLEACRSAWQHLSNPHSDVVSRQKRITELDAAIAKAQPTGEAG